MMAHLRNSAMYRPACRISHTGVRSASARYTVSHSSAVFKNTMTGQEQYQPSPRATRSSKGSALATVVLCRPCFCLVLLQTASCLPIRAESWVCIMHLGSVSLLTFADAC